MSLNFLARTSTLIATGVLTLVFLTLIYLFLVIPLTGPLLDAVFGYDYEFVTGVMQSYGTDGRDLYVMLSLTLDTLLPLSYVALGTGLIHRLKPGYKSVLAYPIVTGCLDLLENVQIMAMLVQFPEISDMQVGFSSFTNKSKFVLFTVSVIMILWLAVRRATRNREEK